MKRVKWYNTLHAILPRGVIWKGINCVVSFQNDGQRVTLKVLWCETSGCFIVRKKFKFTYKFKTSLPPKIQRFPGPHFSVYVRKSSATDFLGLEGGNYTKDIYRMKYAKSKCSATYFYCGDDWHRDYTTQWILSYITMSSKPLKQLFMKHQFQKKTKHVKHLHLK